MVQYDYYVTSEDNTYSEWTEVGASPYLDAIDAPTNHVAMPSAGRLKRQGIFDYADSGAENSGTIDSAQLQVYCLGVADPDLGYPSLGLYYWDGSAWNYLSALTSSGWSWKVWTVIAKIDSWAKVDGFRMYLRSSVYSAQAIDVDCSRLRLEVTPAPPTVAPARPLINKPLVNPNLINYPIVRALEAKLLRSPQEPQSVGMIPWRTRSSLRSLHSSGT